MRLGHVFGKDPRPLRVGACHQDQAREFLRGTTGSVGHDSEAGKASNEAAEKRAVALNPMNVICMCPESDGVDGTFPTIRRLKVVTQRKESCSKRFKGE